jgi:hypothetical protein
MCSHMTRPVAIYLQNVHVSDINTEPELKKFMKTKAVKAFSWPKHSLFQGCEGILMAEASPLGD